MLILAAAYGAALGAKIFKNAGTVVVEEQAAGLGAQHRAPPVAAEGVDIEESAGIKDAVAFSREFEWGGESLVKLLLLQLMASEGDALSQAPIA